jgi:hypothetical protein
VPLPVAIHAPVVDSGRAHRQRAVPRHQLARACLAVADHQGAPARVASLAIAPDVVLDLRLKRFMEHSQRPALQELVQRGPQFFVLFRRLLDYSQHGWRLLHPVAKPGRVL